MNTPQKTIELVKKWLDDPESVSKEELRKAAAEADAAAAEAASAAAADASYLAAYAADAAAYAADAAADAAEAAAYFDAYSADVAKHGVKRYEKLAHKEAK